MKESDNDNNLYESHIDIYNYENWDELEEDLNKINAEIIRIPESILPIEGVSEYYAVREGTRYFQIIKTRLGYCCGCLDETGICDHINRVKESNNEIPSITHIIPFFIRENIEIREIYMVQDEKNPREIYEVIETNNYIFYCSCEKGICKHIVSARAKKYTFLNQNLRITFLIDDYQSVDDNKIKGLFNVQDSYFANFYYMVIRTTEDEFFCACGGIENGEICNHISEIKKEKVRFEINKYITLKLEDGKTNIYVFNPETQRLELFRTCKFLLLNIDPNNTDQRKINKEIDSIDDAELVLSREMEILTPESFKLDKETEFWGHCSNLQAWVENDYDTRILHRNLAFPLLNKLAKNDDPLAIRVFKKELLKRLLSGSRIVQEYLVKEGYINKYFTDEEIKNFEDLDLV